MAKQKIHIKQHGGLGLVWFAGWLFTMGYMELSFGKTLLALLVWPYYIGTAIAMVSGEPPQPAP